MVSALSTSVRKSKLLNLATEIRQSIILLALPCEYVASGATPEVVSSLMLSCKILSADVRQVLHRWSPTLVITNPLQLGLKLPKVFDTIPRSHFTHVKLVIFHDASLLGTRYSSEVRAVDVPSAGYLGNYDIDNHNLDARSTLLDWALATSKPVALSIDVRRLEVDITPAPGWLRKHYPQQAFAWMNNIRHRAFVADADSTWFALMLQQLYPGFESSATYVVGTLPHGSQASMENLVSKISAKQIPVKFEAQCHTSTDECDEGVCIESVGLALANKEIELHAQRGLTSWEDRRFWIKIKDLVKLTQWDRYTEDMFKRCLSIDPDWTKEHLKTLLTFVAEEGCEITFDAEPRCRRGMTVMLARCLLLTTKSRDEDLPYKLVVTRKKRSRFNKGRSG